MKRKKPYTLHFIHNGKSPREDIKNLVKTELKKVLAKNYATVDNVDEVAYKYVTEEMHDGQNDEPKQE